MWSEYGIASVVEATHRLFLNLRIEKLSIRKRTVQRTGTESAAGERKVFAHDPQRDALNDAQ